MPRLNSALIAGAVVLFQVLPAQAINKNDVSKTHELVNSNGKTVASEVVEHRTNDVLKTHQLVNSNGKTVASEIVSPTPTHTKIHSVRQRHNIRSAGRYDTMVHAIHQAARRPEYAYRSH